MGQHQTNIGLNDLNFAADLTDEEIVASIKKTQSPSDEDSDDDDDDIPLAMLLHRYYSPPPPPTTASATEALAELKRCIEHQPDVNGTIFDNMIDLQNFVVTKAVSSVTQKKITDYVS